MLPKSFRTYENGLLLILAVSFGFAFFDRNAINYLAPYLVRDLGLNNTQIGMLGSALALSWALSGLAVGRWSDAVGVRKPFLVVILLIFSACSILSGLATSFPMLLAARLIMGIAEGPLMPICLAIMTVESSPMRRGLNIGIVQSVFSSLLGAAIAPLVLVQLAELFSWRVAFFLSGIPGILCAIAVMIWVREPQAAPCRKNANSRKGGPERFVPHVARTQHVAVPCDRLPDGVLADASPEFSALVPNDCAPPEQPADEPGDGCDRPLCRNRRLYRRGNL